MMLSSGATTTVTAAAHSGHIAGGGGSSSPPPPPPPSPPSGRGGPDIDALRSKWSSYSSYCKASSTRENLCLQSGGGGETTRNCRQHKEHPCATVTAPPAAPGATATIATATATGDTDAARDTCGERDRRYFLYDVIRVYSQGSDAGMLDVVQPTAQRGRSLLINSVVRKIEARFSRLNEKFDRKSSLLQAIAYRNVK